MVNKVEKEIDKKKNLVWTNHIFFFSFTNSSSRDKEKKIQNEQINLRDVTSYILRVKAVMLNLINEVPTN